MPNKVRPEPHIPDHEVLRKIGGGAYGEVWMARGVTGALRAVKVVRREDFEDERGFEREFEGILKFEPISRDHPGFVNILHVGRSADNKSFYYYVMELGDDRQSGREINPVEYEARTLRSDIVAAAGKPLSVELCVSAGIRLAEALEHLHEKGLAHRDVKPANVIFVGGKAKLADIGLVATKGQITFVGTEGFVPPEGPGSAQADVYSLGKVLYEIATGKDRLQFPELPDDHHPDTDPKQWLSLNQVICDICEPKVSQRTITTAGALAKALISVRDGRKVKTGGGGLKKVALAALLLGGAGYGVMQWKPWGQPGPTPTPVITRPTPNPGQNPNGTGGNPTGPVEPEKKMCSVTVISNPLYAEVFDEEGRSLGYTVLPPMDYEQGKKLQFTFKLEGYKPQVFDYEVPEEDFDIVEVNLVQYLPPKEGEIWVDPVGIRYIPKDDFHVSSFLRQQHWNRFLKSKPVVDTTGVKAVEYSENGEVRQIMVLREQQAQRYAEWLTKLAIEGGLLDEDQHIVAVADKDLNTAGYSAADKAAQLYPFRLRAENIPYATLEIVSEPEGARIFLDGEFLGQTPFTLEKVLPGKKKIELSLDGFKNVAHEIVLEAKETRRLPVTLKPKRRVFGENFENQLGMKFVPVTDSLSASIWETRIKDFEVFIKETNWKAPRKPPYTQEPTHPVVWVDRDDAVAFCDWLTKRDRAADIIALDHEYRLPTDLEWSALCLLEDEPELEIPARVAKNKDHFPWDGGWPLTKKLTNISDVQHGRTLRPADRSKKALQNYDDGYAYTSPVGSFPANALGIHDLGGNVSEWVSDRWTPNSKYGVLRGGNITSFQRDKLRTSGARSPQRPGFETTTSGFRVVLSKIQEEAPEPDDQPEEDNG